MWEPANICDLVLTGACNWDRAGVNVLGKVSPGEAKLGLPFTNTYGYLGKCIGTSAVIAILGFLVGSCPLFPFLSVRTDLSCYRTASLAPKTALASMIIPSGKRLFTPPVRRPT